VRICVKESKILYCTYIGKKEGTLHYMEEAYILVFITSGTNMAHFFKHMPIRQISRKNSKCLMLPVIGPSLTVHFAEKYLI
jgi:hypothetical protein